MSRSLCNMQHDQIHANNPVHIPGQEFQIYCENTAHLNIPGGNPAIIPANLNISLNIPH